MRWSSQASTTCARGGQIARPGLTRAEVVEYVRAGEDAWAQGSAIPAVVVHRGEVAGVIGARIAREAGRAEVGYWLGAASVGRGIMTRAVRAVVQTMFDDEGLHRVELRTAADNRPSRDLAERLGFTLEGVLPRGVPDRRRSPRTLRLRTAAHRSVNRDGRSTAQHPTKNHPPFAPEATASRTLQQLAWRTIQYTQGAKVQIQEVRIENFRAHARTIVPISNFGCLIGENNAGKSSVLHAIHLALKGAPPSKLDESDFRDPDLPINIELVLIKITQKDLEKIADDNHRSSVAKIVQDGKLTLVRSAAVNTKTTLQYLSKQPIDSKWSLDALNAAMKGNTGSELRDAATSVLPDLKSVESPLTSQAKVREAREELLLGLDPEEFELRPTPLPTGIEAALRPIFPEVIYIEAVKDTAAEVKTSDSATFGKLLRILLDAVAGEITNLTSAFSDVQRKLSRIRQADGTIEDLRLDQVREIESTIEKLVQESFPGVTLQMEVPAPDLKMILNSAELNIDDGHEGPIGRKGDGLKRAVAFAILRAYMAFQKDGLASSDQDSKASPAYLLLFEEPELYLHPRAQRQLFEALSVFAANHQVLVTTHSPSFFSADATSTFVKLYKSKGSDEKKMSSKALPIDLRDAVSLRDAFQIICHENNEAALFSRVVVLVEGDSDTIVFPHLAKTLDSSWDHIAENISFIQTGGKSNIRRYRDFFALFEIPVHAIVDLDAIDEGFEHISQDGDTKAKRNLVMDIVARKMNNLAETDEPGGKIRSAPKSTTQRARWNAAKNAFASWKEDPNAGDFDTVRQNLDELFAWTQGSARLEILASRDAEVSTAIDALLHNLREEKSHILRRGDLEAYYSSPPVKRAGDKVRAAVDFCQEITSSDDLKGRHGVDGASVEQELREIFASIYS